MSAKNHDIDTLNELITSTIDSVDGYRKAGEDSNSGQFQPIFFSRASERREVAERLQDEVRNLGGEPSDDGSLMGAADRAFMTLREVISGDDEKAIVAEVERGEDKIKAKFEDAIADGKLSPETRNVISNAYTSVKAGHDQMRDLKHGLKN